MKKITLKQLAELSGTSIGTVDRALHGRGRINSETRDKILRIADEYNYAPNIMASTLSRKKNYRIGIIMAEFPDEFCRHLKHGIEDAAAFLQSYSFTYDFLITSSLAEDAQMSVINRLDTSLYDAFLVNAGSDSVAQWIRKMSDEGKIIATFNSNSRGSGQTFYVGEDPYKAGQLMGNYICNVIPDLRSLVILKGFQSNYSHIQRCLGVKSVVVENNPSAQIYEYEYFDDENTAREITDSFIKKGEKIDAFFSSSGAGTAGIGKALSSADFPLHSKIFGYDVTKATIELMKQNLCLGVIFQDPYQQSYNGMKMLIEHLVLNTKLERKNYYIRSRLLLKSNAEEYLYDQKEENNRYLI